MCSVCNELKFQVNLGYRGAWSIKKEPKNEQTFAFKEKEMQ